MLVLKRKVGERIMVGDDIEITITDAGFGWAKVGVDAPDGVVILREELFYLDEPDERDCDHASAGSAPQFREPQKP